jgi:hypothetical protein
MKKNYPVFLTKAQLAEALNLPIADIDLMIKRGDFPPPWGLFSVERWTLRGVIEFAHERGFTL